MLIFLEMNEPRIAAKAISLGRIAAALVVLAACTPDDERSSDRSYGAVQERGKGVMGVDQYTSQHVFQDLRNGGRIILERDDASDAKAISQIRAHMRDVATDFRNGDFSKPFAVHAMDVPGTDVMSDRKTGITYAVVDRPRGAELRILSTDALTVDAIHRFLAFQRSDHRAKGADSMGAHTKTGGH